MEPTSTDKRIDDLSDRVGRFEDNVDRRFDKVDRRFERFEDDVDTRFDKVDAQFAGLATKEELAKIDVRLDKWGKIVSSGVVVIVGGVILKLIGA
jgi:hypothetical protein